MKEQENERLKLHLRNTCLHNELMSTHQQYTIVEECGNSSDEACASKVIAGEGIVNQDKTDDSMEPIQLKLRLQKSENKLRRTRVKLLNIQATMKVRQRVHCIIKYLIIITKFLKCIVTENNALKAEVEESKAIIRLQELQASNYYMKYNDV